MGTVVLHEIVYVFIRISAEYNIQTHSISIEVNANVAVATLRLHLSVLMFRN